MTLPLPFALNQLDISSRNIGPQIVPLCCRYLKRIMIRSESRQFGRSLADVHCLVVRLLEIIDCFHSNGAMAYWLVLVMFTLMVGCST